MKIVVIGGTGLIGSKVVAKLTEHGHEAVPASPRLGINTITGEGLAAALDGASVVVDVSNSPSFDYAPALEFFGKSTTQPPGRGSRPRASGTTSRLSVVGTKELSEGGDLNTTIAGYFWAKAAQEALIKASSIPYTIVHATQFFEFLKSDRRQRHRRRERSPATACAFQPMAADDVAKAVGRAAVGAPVNGVVEVGRTGAVPLRHARSVGSSTAHGRPTRGAVRSLGTLLRGRGRRRDARPGRWREPRRDPTSTTGSASPQPLRRRPAPGSASSRSICRRLASAIQPTKEKVKR